jgi:outer membrane protein assembly factor BamB
MRATVRLLAVGCLLAAPCLAGAANWPRFRGPNGAGTADDKTIPVSWDHQGILWKVDLPGVGNGSPVIWGDRLFLEAASADSKQRMLVCLNVADGKVVWSRSVPGAPGKTHAKNSLASSTPATDGERVYPLFWDGARLALHAYDFQGGLIWKQDVGPFTSGGKDTLSQHGPAGSPMLVDGKVILNYDTDKFASVVAYEAKTGKLAWKVDRPSFRTCYSTPLVLEHGGEAPELIVGSTAGLTSYNPASGAVNWNFTWTFDNNRPLRTVASPLYSQGYLFLNSGDGDGSRHLIAVKAGGKGDVSRTNLTWENKKLFPYVPCLLASGDHLYFVNDKGIAGCAVAKTGEIVWTERLGAGVTSSPVLIDGKVYSASETGEVFVFAAQPTFKKLGKSNLGEPVVATPAVADGKLFVRGTEHLFCIGK